MIQTAPTLNGSKPAQALLHLLTDGFYALDGGQVYSDTPKMVWQDYAKPDRRNRVTQGLNLLLLELPGLNVLIDTGLGHIDPVLCREVYRHSASKLSANLQAAGVPARNIDLVILSNLRLDHSGGTVTQTRDGDFIPLFPKATYMAQRHAWEVAQHPTGRDIRHYPHIDQLRMLRHRGQLDLIDGDTEIAAGIQTIVTDGTGWGDQIVLVTFGPLRVAYLSDLAPTPEHLISNIPYGIEVDRDQVMQTRQKMMEMLADESWTCVFPHSVETPAGFINRRAGHMMFQATFFRSDLTRVRMKARRRHARL